MYTMIEEPSNEEISQVDPDETNQSKKSNNNQYDNQI
jgi:hypothetical protein